jgi:hypothetical protein
MTIARNTGWRVQSYILITKMLAHEWNELRKNTDVLVATGAMIMAAVWFWAAMGLVDAFDQTGER